MSTACKPTASCKGDEARLRYIRPGAGRSIVVGARELLRRRTLWIGFLGAFLPLLLVLGLQYRWLLKLEDATALAGRAVLVNFLEAVSTEILYFYGPAAERALDLPTALVAEERLEGIAAHFKRRAGPGVKVYFTVRFSHDDWGTIYFYDPASERMVAPPASDAARAVTVACAPWKLMDERGIEVDGARLVVEERDPSNRIILIPLLDRESRVVGVAGMILDDRYFREVLLPSTVRSVLPKFFAGGATGSVIVTLRDERGRLLYATDPSAATTADDLTRHLSFVFGDLRLGIRSRDLNPEQWARASFAFNLTLSFLAALLLTGGLALALRTASREIRLSRMKSDFVANVSHELRTPLASIRVFGELLRAGRAATPEKAREYGEYIEAESRRLTQLINNILDFARIEAGQKSYRFTTADVAPLVEETVRTFQARLKSGGYVIELDRGEGSLPPVRHDPDALGQALHNLIDNAVKYSGDSRWVRVTVQASGNRDAILVTVEDRGIGISREEQSRIFERFHRVGTGLVHDVRGSGLGLSIVQHVVKAHGGTVEVRSEPGIGSTFSVRLPVASAEGAAEGPDGARSEALPPAPAEDAPAPSRATGGSAPQAIPGGTRNA
jgi:signal transduction histidine kinase